MSNFPASPPGWRTAITVLLVVIAAGCGRNEPQTVFTTRLPDEATHLDLRWPALKDGTPAVHFRIPREDLDLSRLRGRKPGVIDEIHIKFRVPEENGLRKRMFDALNAETGGRLGEYRSNPDAFKWVELSHVPNNASMRRNRYALWRFNCETCQPDGGFEGLTRFTRMHCFTPPLDEFAQRALANKAEDDPSPEGCILGRSVSYFSNSVDHDQGEEGVDVWCSPALCDTFIQIEGRKIFTSVHRSQLDSVSALASAIRAQFSSYVVK